MLATRETATLVERLLADSIRKQSVDLDQLTIHADRGPSMISKPVALLLADMGVTKSHSRPHCSNDNPIRRRSSRPSSTAPSSPSASAHWRTRGSSTGTLASATTPPPTFTTGRRSWCAPSAPTCSPSPIKATLSASCGYRSHLRYLPPRGSTSQCQRRPRHDRPGTLFLGGLCLNRVDNYRAGGRVLGRHVTSS